MDEADRQVLLVDDEEIILKVCAEALGRAGFEVASCGSGKQALQTFADHRFAAAVVDLVLPDLDGLTLLGAFREADPDIIVVLMTGHASLESAIEAVRRGAYDYLRKPFTADDLARVVRRGLEQRQLTVQNRQLLEELDVMNRDLTEKVRVATEELHAFINLGRRLGQAEGPLPVLGDLTRAAAQLTNARSAAIFAPVRPGLFRCMVAEGEAAADLQRAGLVQEQLFCRCLEQDRPLIQAQLLDDPELASGPMALLGLASAMVAPLTAVTGHVGVMALFDGTEPFNDRQASLVKVLAAQAAEVMALADRASRQSASRDEFIELQDLLGAQP